MTTALAAERMIAANCFACSLEAVALSTPNASGADPHGTWELPSGFGTT